MSKKLVSRLIDSAMSDKRNKAKKNDQGRFTENMLHHSDAKSAASIIGEQAGLNFDIESKAEIHALQTKLGEVNSKLTSLEAEKTDTAVKKSSIQQFKKVRQRREYDDDAPEWSILDKINFVSLITATFICLIVGAANAYSAMIASGNIAFIESPTVPIILSLIVPIGSLSVKQASTFFYYANEKLMYTKVVAILTAIVIVAWTICFASEYGGASAEVSFDYTEEASTGGNWLVWLQLMAELLAASTLALGAEAIYYRYDPDIEEESPDYLSITTTEKKQQSRIDELTLLRSKYQTSLTQLQARREAVINQAVADFMAQKERYSQFKNL